MTRRFALCVAAGFFALAAADPAAAGGRSRGSQAGEHRVAYAESRHGNGTVSGPVRATSTGYEVRLPGGTWIGCRRSCEETLRVEALDMWENDGSLIGAGTLPLECGIFGCLEIRYPR